MNEEMKAFINSIANQVKSVFGEPLRSIVFADGQRIVAGSYGVDVAFAISLS